MDFPAILGILALGAFAAWCWARVTQTPWRMQDRRRLDLPVGPASRWEQRLNARHAEETYTRRPPKSMSPKGRTKRTKYHGK